MKMAIGEKVPFGVESRHSLVNAEPRLQSIKRFFRGKKTPAGLMVLAGVNKDLTSWVDVDDAQCRATI